MITWFMHGGVIMGPLLFLLLIIIGLSIWKAIELFFFGRELSRYRLELCLNAIIFWGGIAAILGYFGHFWGMIRAFDNIALHNEFSPTVMAKGYSVSLIATTFGLIILIFSAIIWFFLRWRYKQLTAAS